MVWEAALLLLLITSNGSMKDMDQFWRILILWNVSRWQYKERRVFETSRGFCHVLVQHEDPQGHDARAP